MHSFGDLTMIGCMFWRRHFRAHTTLFVRAYTTGDNHAHTTTSAFGKVGGQALKAALNLFQTRMHRPH